MIELRFTRWRKSNRVQSRYGFNRIVTNVYVNPTSEPIFISLEKPLKTILSSGGYIAARSKEYFERTMVAPYSVIVLGLRKGDSGPK